MAGKQEFRGKLYEIVEVAQKQGGSMTIEEVERFFEEDQLSEEQIGLVCEYLMSQKVAVSGYVKESGTVKEQSEEQEAVRLSEEEQRYLDEYRRELAELRADDPQEARMAYYLPKIAEEAVKLHHPDIFLGDMIQEGNMSLVMALAEEDGLTEEKVMEKVRAGMLALLESQDETRRQDKKMVERVTELDEAIKTMTEEYGRKVAVDEVAEKLGISEAEIADILKLAGE